MIFRLIYAGEIPTKQSNGTTKNVPIPPHEVLETHGPFLEVMIGPPKIIREQLEKSGKDIPAVSVKALIDTGASSSIIRPEIAEKLNLPHTGYQKITSVQDQQEQPVYFGAIQFSWGSTKEAKLIACPLTSVHCLIGRDVLRHWYLSHLE